MLYISLFSPLLLYQETYIFNILAGTPFVKKKNTSGELYFMKYILFYGFLYKTIPNSILDFAGTCDIFRNRGLCEKEGWKNE